MRSSSHPRGRTGGNSVVRWYVKSSIVGQPSSWPSSSHRENVMPSRIAMLSSVLALIIITGASSAYMA